MIALLFTVLESAFHSKELALKFNYKTFQTSLYHTFFTAVIKEEVA